jgi:integrase
MTQKSEVKRIPGKKLTLADAIERIENLPKKNPRDATSHGEIIAAFKRVAGMTGLTPHDIEATPKAIDALVVGLNAPLAGMTKGSFANVLSRVRRGLRVLGLMNIPKSSHAPLTDAWKSLVATLSTTMRIKISRFSRHCAFNGIEPTSVNQAVFDEFGAVLDANLVGGTAKDAKKCAAIAWNFGRKHIKDWPDIEIVGPPASAARFTLPISAFSEGLRADIDIWHKRVSIAPENDEAAPSKPYRPATVESRLFDLRIIVSAMVQTGMEPTAIASMSDLLVISNVDATLQFLEHRLRTPYSATTARVLTALLGFAKYGPENCREHYPSIAKRLKNFEANSGLRRTTMTEKNRRRITVFNDPAAVKRLLGLSKLLMMEADKSTTPGVEAARKAMVALAIEVLFANPQRAGNLYTLDLSRHFQHVGTGKDRRIFVHVDGAEVKNGEDIDFEVTPTAKAMLRHFLNRYRPILIGKYPQPEGVNFLFPGTKDGHLCHKAAWNMIGRETERHVGVKLSTHHFRHVTAHLVLTSQPGSYELVAKVLGHKDSTTTRRYYAGAEHHAANKHFYDLLRANVAFGGTPKKLNKSPF